MLIISQLAFAALSVFQRIFGMVFDISLLKLLKPREATYVANGSSINNL